MNNKQMVVDPENMLLTTGSQQSIDLLARVYLDPGDTVLVETPTYLAALQVFRSRGVNLVAVESDEDGMNIEDLKLKLHQHRPKLVYVVPTFSNPTGRVWSLERRKGLIQACQAQEVLILEDDPYGEIKFHPQEDYPTLFSLYGQAAGSPVLYTSTFSKTVAPAMRTGWIMGDVEIIQMLTKAKQSADLHSSSMDQQALYQLLSSNEFSLDQHIEEIRISYAARMQYMAEELRRLNWAGIRFIEPLGGMFIWAQLPEGLDAEVLLACSVQKGIAFVPGAVFYCDNPQRNTVRLNFTHTDREHTRKGMELLKTALEECTAKL
jgi:2-aminoadipate transaminase